MPYSDELMLEKLAQIAHSLDRIACLLTQVPARTAPPSQPKRTSIDDLMTPIEAAKYLSVTAITLAIWRSTGRYELPWVKVGRLVRYRRSDLDRFLQLRIKNADPPKADAYKPRK